MSQDVSVLVLNASYEPFKRVDFKKAVRMLFRGVAVVVEGDETRKIGPHAWPKVVMLVKYVYEKWLDRPAAWHKGGVYIRDGHRCAYCGVLGADSIDHVFPAARGGLWAWENCVAACKSCNGRKRNRTPEEAGMVLRYATAYVPTIRELRDKARAAKAA
jgi:5-methylcytosine-specific restriction endonuclease McrA